MMAETPLVLEPLEHGKTAVVIKKFLLRLYGFRRTGAHARITRAAAGLEGLIRIERHVGQHRVVPHVGTELWMDEKIISSYPADTGKYPYMLVRDMRLLILPVNHLGRGKRQGLVTFLLYLARQKIGDHIEPVIDLPVMMLIKKRRSITDRLEHAP